METKENATSQPPKLGAFAAYRYGWKVLKRYFLELLIILVLSWVASFPLMFSSESGIFETSNFFSFAYLILFLIPLGYGVDYAFLRAVLDKHPRIGDILEFFNNYTNVLAAGLLVHVFVSVGFLMLIVPGFIFMCKLAFVPYLVTFHRVSALESIRLSWRMTRGYAWTIFRIWLIAVPIYLLGLAALGVGVIVSAMWVTLANAALYYRAADQNDILKQFLTHRERYSSRKTSSNYDSPSGTSSDQDSGLPNLLDRD